MLRSGAGGNACAKACGDQGKTGLGQPNLAPVSEARNPRYKPQALAVGDFIRHHHRRSHRAINMESTALKGDSRVGVRGPDLTAPRSDRVAWLNARSGHSRNSRRLRREGCQCAPYAHKGSQCSDQFGQ